MVQHFWPIWPALVCSPLNLFLPPIPAVPNIHEVTGTPNEIQNAICFEYGLMDAMIDLQINGGFDVAGQARRGVGLLRITYLMTREDYNKKYKSK